MCTTWRRSWISTACAGACACMYMTGHDMNHLAIDTLVMKIVRLRTLSECHPMRASCGRAVAGWQACGRVFLGCIPDRWMAAKPNSPWRTAYSVRNLLIICSIRRTFNNKDLFVLRSKVSSRCSSVPSPRAAYWLDVSEAICTRRMA